MQIYDNHKKREEKQSWKKIKLCVSPKLNEPTNMAKIFFLHIIIPIPSLITILDSSSIEFVSKPSSLLFSPLPFFLFIDTDKYVNDQWQIFHHRKWKSISIYLSRQTTQQACCCLSHLFLTFPIFHVKKGRTK